MKKILNYLILIVLLLPIWTQANPNSSVEENRLEALRSLLTAIQTKEAEVDRIRSELAMAENEIDSSDLSQQLVNRTNELKSIRAKFTESAAGIDMSPFEEKQEESFSWESALGKILQPILTEVESATSRSRKLAELEDEYQKFATRKNSAISAIETIQATLEATDDTELSKVLEEQLAKWKERSTLSSNQANAAYLQKKAYEEKGKGVFSGTAPYIRSFLSKRGLNLLMGFGSALLVFVLLRLLLYILKKFRQNENPNKLGSRIFVLLTNLLSIVGAIAALIIAFSAAGDLFLLGIVLVFLIGAAWAGIKVIPQFIESLKIILNIGMVRENQRIIFDDIPWNVESLGFSCKLVNPELDNGIQSLPVKRLVGLHSRQWCEDEKPFPCHRGDWVELNDKIIGESISQNPGTVTLKELGGSLITYSTVDFLNKSPRNLSVNGFRVQTRFGIDYKHQLIATNDVIVWFKEHLEKRLPEIFTTASIKEISVQFANAGAHSLDYEIEVDLEGTSAPLYERISFSIQRLLVEACNIHELIIPFHQLTLHKAIEE